MIDGPLFRGISSRMGLPDATVGPTRRNAPKPPDIPDGVWPDERRNATLKALADMAAEFTPIGDARALGRIVPQMREGQYGAAALDAASVMPVAGSILDLMRAGKLATPLRQAPKGIEAWHGSPYRGIDKFDLDAIGKGEGAQAFGFGFYAAQDRKLAEAYRDAGAARRGTKRGGLYRLGIDADEGRLLDLDAPVAQQGDFVRGVLEKLGIRRGTGKQIVDYLGHNMDPEGASSLLDRSGIHGSRYLDGKSRAAGQGTRNYVVFDPHRIKILEALGLAGVAGAGGYRMMNRPDPMEREQ